MLQKDWAANSFADVAFISLSYMLSHFLEKADSKYPETTKIILLKRKPCILHDIQIRINSKYIL